MLKLTLAGLLLLLAGCLAVPTYEQRQADANALAMAKDWHPVRLETQPFKLVAYLPRQASQAETLTVYIEGDGFAWASRSQPSSDPTPRTPVALQLALAQLQGQAVYLARPCQFIDAQKTGCHQRYWTDARFAPQVVQSMNEAVDEMKQVFKAKEIVLVGYSGGGAIAALLATRRDDVVRLVTVAGNLDHEAWTRHHRVSKLSGSLNPALEAAGLGALPQTHFIGSKDKVITPMLANQWPVPIRGSDSANVIVVQEFDHVCCWVENWTELYEME